MSSLSLECNTIDNNVSKDIFESLNDLHNGNYVWKPVLSTKLLVFPTLGYFEKDKGSVSISDYVMVDIFSFLDEEEKKLLFFQLINLRHLRKEV